MLKLPIPTDAAGTEFSAGEVFALCVSKVRDAGLKARLVALCPDIESAATAYKAAATAAQLHVFPRKAALNSVTNKELIAVYNGRMVSSKGPGRPIYDRIMMGGQDTCPVCGVGYPTTLDHHLPKNHYGALVVSPINLVPCCTWCQGEKRTHFPKTEGEQLLHPYFDDFTNDEWIVAEVIEGSPAAFRFRVEAPSTWNETKAARAAEHFKTLGLARLYTKNAGNELRGLAQYLTNLALAGGPAAVKSHLAERLKSLRAVSLNGWQTVMYRAAKNSAWFCEGGYRA